MSETRVITGLVRFSYANVFVPKAAVEGEKEKYSVSILIPKKNKEALKEIAAAIDAAVELSAGKFKNKDPKKTKNFKWPLRDGDEEYPDDEALKGMMFIGAASNSKPAVVDSDRDPILDSNDFYSGCWGRASLNFYGFNASGNVGIACGLNNLQKLKDDENLSGKTSASEDFAEDYDGEDLLA